METILYIIPVKVLNSIHITFQRNNFFIDCTITTSIMPRGKTNYNAVLSFESFLSNSSYLSMVICRLDLILVAGAGKMVAKLNLSRPTNLVNCEFHYQAMQYGRVPLNCPICPTGQNGRKVTFWKYQFMTHKMQTHLSQGY